MKTSTDVFTGTWRLVPEESQFDPNHRPSEGTVRFERDGLTYRMTAEGVCDGQKVAEHPQTFVIDGEPHPVPDVEGMTATAVCEDGRTIQIVARQADATVGRAEYAVSEDGMRLTASASGTDAQNRPFTTTTVWRRDA